MADRAEASKVTAFHGIGAVDVAKAAKVVAYVLLEPGEDPGDDSIRLSQVFSNVVRRPT